MRKSAAAIILVSALAGALLLSLVSANIIPYVILPEITIGSDGSISPQTDLIVRNGNTYTLTADVQEKPIVIECSNIIFDGAGHTVNITTGDNPALWLREVSNVIVENTNLLARNIYTLYLRGCSGCIVSRVQNGKLIRISGNYNNITESDTGIAVFEGSNNLITRNNISDVLVGSGSSNTFFRNNFYLTDYPGLYTESLWDNGSIGNYWSNYTTKYPNASELDSTGIGDTPYIIQREPYTTREYPNQTNIDRYPLMYPWGAPAIHVNGLMNETYYGSYFLNFTLSKPATWMGYSLDGEENVTVTGNATLSGLSSGLHNVTVYAKDAFENEAASKTITFTVKEPFPVVPIAAGVAVVVVVIVAAGLLFYRRKRSKKTQPT